MYYLKATTIFLTYYSFLVQHVDRIPEGVLVSECPFRLHPVQLGEGHGAREPEQRLHILPGDEAVRFQICPYFAVHLLRVEPGGVSFPFLAFHVELVFYLVLQSLFRPVFHRLELYGKRVPGFRSGDFTRFLPASQRRTEIADAFQMQSFAPAEFLHQLAVEGGQQAFHVAFRE